MTDEQKLIEIYTELTGCSEPAARSVFMLVCPQEEDRESFLHRPVGANELLSKPIAYQ